MRLVSISKYTKTEKGMLILSCLAAAFLAFPKTAGAMHIMEGHMPIVYSAAWGALCLPFLTAGFISIRRIVQRQKRILMLLAMSGAFIFVISSLKIPSATGSCSHMTGTGLSAILFGPLITSVLGIIVLVFQAILLAHGGLTTLGANTFSMAIIGPIFTCLLFILGKKIKLNRKINVFIAVSLGSLLT
jgi:cobalt/nickel transport system permease protein